MSAGSCASCAHWSNPWAQHQDTIPDDLKSRWGTCQAIDLPGWHWYDDENNRPAPDLLAFTMDGSDYRADFHTREDFGCVLHSERVSKEPEEPA